MWVLPEGASARSRNTRHTAGQDEADASGLSLEGASFEPCDIQKALATPTKTLSIYVNNLARKLSDHLLIKLILLWRGRGIQAPPIRGHGPLQRPTGFDASCRRRREGAELFCTALSIVQNPLSKRVISGWAITTPTPPPPASRHRALPPQAPLACRGSRSGAASDRPCH